MTDKRPRDKSFMNYRLIAENVSTIDLQGIIDRVIYESKKCSSDRKLETIAFHLENKAGSYFRFDVYRKHTYGKPSKE
jgi:hypothetical protein